jgi:hypothetical protein
LSFSICLATRQFLWRAPGTYSREVKNSPPAFSSCKLKVHFYSLIHSGLERGWCAFNHA